MMGKNKTWLRRTGTGIGTVVACALIALAVSPPLRSHFGSVAPAHERARGIDFTLPVVGGGHWTLSDHRGKVVLVNFWATWCPPCRMETPDLVEVYNEYAARGFTIAGISMDDDPSQAAPGFAARYGIKYPILIPSSDTPLTAQAEVLPTSFLIDKYGRVARAYRGMISESVLKNDIERLLGEGNNAGQEPARLRAKRAA